MVNSFVNMNAFPSPLAQNGSPAKGSPMFDTRHVGGPIERLLGFGATRFTGLKFSSWAKLIFLAGVRNSVFRVSSRCNTAPVGKEQASGANRFAITSSGLST
jgi:hypothetical protein